MGQYPRIGGNGAAAETLFDDAIAAAESGLDHPGPTLLEGESASIDRIVSPRDRIPIAQDSLHVISQSLVRLTVAGGIADEELERPAANGPSWRRRPRARTLAPARLLCKGSGGGKKGPGTRPRNG